MKLTLEGAQAKVIVDGKISNPFVISRGVREGDGLYATLFNPILHIALKNMEQSNTILTDRHKSVDMSMIFWKLQGAFSS